MLAIGLVVGWPSLLFYGACVAVPLAVLVLSANARCRIARGHRQMGPLVVMLYSMVVSDIMRFTFIFILIIFGFSQGEDCMRGVACA